jgi:hypothetical protein
VNLAAAKVYNAGVKARALLRQSLGHVFGYLTLSVAHYGMLL